MYLPDKLTTSDMQLLKLIWINSISYHKKKNHHTKNQGTNYTTTLTRQKINSAIQILLCLCLQATSHSCQEFLSVLHWLARKTRTCGVFFKTPIQCVIKSVSSTSTKSWSFLQTNKEIKGAWAPVPGLGFLKAVYQRKEMETPWIT